MSGKRSALGAMGSQGMQALASFTIQVLVARTLGFDGLGAFAIAYGVMVLVAGLASGMVGDSLVVLERRAPPVRSALQQFAGAIAVTAALLSATIAAASGLMDAATAVMFGAGVALFALEEVMRRLLMAGFGFWRVMLIDFASFVVALAVVGLSALAGSLSLFVFLAAVAAGQLAAISLGIVLLPREERTAPFSGTASGGRVNSSCGQQCSLSSAPSSRCSQASPQPASSKRAASLSPPPPSRSAGSARTSSSPSRATATQR